MLFLRFERRTAKKKKQQHCAFVQQKTGQQIHACTTMFEASMKFSIESATHPDAMLTLQFIIVIGIHARRHIKCVACSAQISFMRVSSIEHVCVCVDVFEFDGIHLLHNLN